MLFRSCRCFQRQSLARRGKSHLRVKCQRQAVRQWRFAAPARLVNEDLKSIHYRTPTDCPFFPEYYSVLPCWVRRFIRVVLSPEGVFIVRLLVKHRPNASAISIRARLQPGRGMYFSFMSRLLSRMESSLCYHPMSFFLYEAPNSCWTHFHVSTIVSCPTASNRIGLESGSAIASVGRFPDKQAGAGALPQTESFTT